MWVCLPESGSKTLASCSLEAIYLLYLECPSNAQDLVPLGPKKRRIEFMKFADSGCYLCLIHWRCLSWVAQGSVQLGQLSSVKVWVNWVHLVVCFQGPHQEETTGLHPSFKMESWVQSWRPRANEFCDFSWFFHSICVKCCACHAKVMPGHTKCCTCHAKSS